MVKNSGFEEGDNFWEPTNKSSVNFIVNEDTSYEGSRSAFINNNNKNSYGIEQSIYEIDSHSSYLITASIKSDVPSTEKALIRIAWYESKDASGSQYSTNDSPFISINNQWQRVEFTASPPKETIQSAKIRLLVANGSAYFDDILFEAYVLPSPTPTIVIPTPTENLIFSPSPTIQSTPTPSLNLISYENIFISEVMVNPSNGEKEWIEVYNNNDFSVDIIDWFIDDVENSGGSPKKFSLSILPKSYAIVELAISIFNNDGDVVRLLDFNKVEKDGFEYQGSEKGKSWGRINFESDSFCLQEPSKNQANNLCLSLTPTISSTKILSSTTSVSLSLEPSPRVQKLTSDAIGREKKPNQKIYQSYSLKEKGEILGVENLGNKMIQMNDFSLEKEKGNQKQNPLLPLLLYYSTLTSFLFFRRILMAIEIKNQ